MQIKQIIVVKETRANETRVALTPTEVKQLTPHHSVLVETAAGQLAGFSDEAYRAAGAEIIELAKSGFPAHSFILRVKLPSEQQAAAEADLYHKPTLELGFLGTPAYTHFMHQWQAAERGAYSFELLSSLATDDPKNALTQMSRFAGKIALQDALKRHPEAVRRVTVLGTGPAAFSAALAARAEQLPVQLFGRREHYRPSAESAGISYYVLPEAEAEQARFVEQYLHNSDIIIAAARSAGKPAPVLVDEHSLAKVPSNAILVDLALSEGGNIKGSKSDQVVSHDRGIRIINVTGYPKLDPHAASQAYGQCMLKFVQAILTDQGELNLQQPLLQEACLVAASEPRQTCGMHP